VLLCCCVAKNERRTKARAAGGGRGRGCRGGGGQGDGEVWPKPRGSRFEVRGSRFEVRGLAGLVRVPVVSSSRLARLGGLSIEQRRRSLDRSAFCRKFLSGFRSGVPVWGSSLGYASTSSKFLIERPSSGRLRLDDPLPAAAWLPGCTHT